MKNKPRARAMLRLSSTLRQLSELSGEPDVFEVKAADALECLQVMVRQYPSMKKWAYKGDELLPIIRLFASAPEQRGKLPPDDYDNP